MTNGLCVKTIYAFLSLFLLLSVSGWGASPNAAGNLLEEKKWQFRQTTKKGAVESQQSSDELIIRKTDRGTDDHVWWSQKLEAEKGGVYHLSFEAKASGEEDHSVYVGVDFLDQNGKFIGFKELRKICYINPKFPGATIPDVTDWKIFESDFTVPREAGFMSVRLALGGSTPVEVSYRKIAVNKAAVPVAEVLDQLPTEIPVQTIALDPVSAEGITLTPNWKRQGAEVIESKVRSRFCLNGLWAIQPAVKNEGPKAGDWAFMKVPNVLQSGNAYLAYGQAKTSWKNRNLFTDAEALWFVRDLEIPTTKDAKIVLEIGSFRGFALAIYWNGKRLGTMTNQLGARIDLSSVARPGEKGQLALYALALPPESQYAYLMEAGQMPRQYDSTRFARETNRSNYVRGLADIYLQVEPARSIFDAVRLVPSTRNKELEVVCTGGAVEAAALNYTATIRGADGATVLEKSSLKAEKKGDGWGVKVPWTNPRLWTPDDPYLYHVTVRASNSQGAVIDETLPIRFGFREVWVEGKQLMLNGRPLHLRPKLAFTAFMDGPAMRRHFSFLKDMGFNCMIRPWAGNSDQLEVYEEQSLADFYEAADSVGFFVIPYTPYLLVSRGQFGTDGAESIDLDELMNYLRKNQVERLANHPSVIAYSGFGGGYSEGINYVNARPDTWGVSPLAQEGILDRVLSSPDNRRKALETMRRSKEFVQRFKALDLSRPFLSHIDTGEGDGWGIFDYFNWTPIQEWEEWPTAWAKDGVMPIGSTEHGLPYPASFVSHAIPDGNSEPWVTEYSAMVLGPEAYAREKADYLQFIRSSYNKATGTYPPKAGAHHYYAETAVSKNWENTQAVWVDYNRAIYRTWRTYGIPMGIEPFGRLPNLVDQEFLKKGSGQLLVDAGTELRTTGAKLDRWLYMGYWPSVTMPSLPTAPTGRKPQGLTLLGEALYEVNSPLLVYIAGSSQRVTAKDHVFASGETIAKQIAAIWDGFTDRKLELQWKAQVGGKNVGEGKELVTLKSGDIQFFPVKFTAPMVVNRSEGQIELAVIDATSKEVVSRDRFAFQIYPVLTLSERVKKAKVVLFDPTGGSESAFRRLGINPTLIKNLSEWKGGDLLVIGREALPAFGRQSSESIPSSVPILVLEQGVNALESVGLRTYPVRPRTVFPLAANHSALSGVEADDLRDWRVEPRLLESGIEPLRNGYNYHVGYYGAVASVTIETPTRGNFTPLLQSGFDLRETPLLEATLKDRRWLFCQLSVVDGIFGVSPEMGDPVGARILVNLVDYLMGKKVATPSAFGVMGDAADVDLARELGADIGKSISMGQLNAMKVVLVGKSVSNPAALKAWVEQGGTAVVMPQNPEFYTTVSPTTAVASKTLSLTLVPSGRVFEGLGQSDFHYRGLLPLRTFNGEDVMKEVPAGNGRWIFVGFDPRRLDVKDEPWMRFTYRHQYRALSQVLTNLGVALDLPSESMYERFKRTPFQIDLTASAKARILERKEDQSTGWTAPEFDASRWRPFGLTGQTTTFGDACLRISFTVPKEIAEGNLVADLGTMDDYDETWLNGVKIGSVNPDNSKPEQAYQTRRIYSIPAGLLKPGTENVLAIRAWNRNAAKGTQAQVRGPMFIRMMETAATPYVGDLKHSDDPYLQHHW
ncbi:MAG: hypothetical protein B9S32_09135 [Verrucomicrobia bacterium Tous-C9LFEB]|nr:MAG: hypothetical protein B9S32_09135 [Verrucomicrobia bacterium Tous-C9LFEB]